MAETRVVEQTRVYKLILNPVSGRCEEGVVCALATDYSNLINWYKDQFAEEPYREDGYLKQFKKSSILEFYNPADSIELNQTDHWFHGISDEWVQSDKFWNVVGSGNYFFVG